MNKKFIFSLVILISTTIGAGIFGLPYVVSKTGVLPSFFYFLILGAVVLLVQLFFSEIILRTNGKFRIVGYAQKYLGLPGRLLIIVSSVIGLSGSLLAYGILAGNFLKIAFSPLGIGLSSFVFSLIFLIGLSFFIFKGIKMIIPIGIFTNIVFFLIILAIFLIGAPKLDFSNFSLINTKNLFLPYGVIMFSLVGWMAIPEINDILKSSEEKRLLKKVIIISAVFCALIYLCFSFVVFGISGKETSIEALQGLIPFLGTKVILFGAAAAVVTLIDSFLIIGLSLRNILVYDLKLPKLPASLITCALPIILFLAGFQSFINTIGFIGTILGAIEGIIIILIYKKAKKIYDREPEYSLKVPSFLINALVVIFILGAIAQILDYI